MQGGDKEEKTYLKKIKKRYWQHLKNVVIYICQKIVKGEKIMKELSRDNLTEKGNLKTSTQKAIREQAIKTFTDSGYELMPNGKL